MTENRPTLGWPADLPHAPAWNLLPRVNQVIPWNCTWHGAVSTLLCAECRWEYDEYRETGTWTGTRCACWETCQNDAEPDGDMCAECLSEGCPGGRGEPDADR